MKIPQCIILYKSLVLPITDYEDIICMDVQMVSLDAVHTPQNRACRIILQALSQTPSVEIHQNPSY